MRADGPRKVGVHLSLVRPLLLMGCEREPLLLTAVITVALVFVLGNLIFAIVGIAFWTVAVALLSRMAKHDPQLSAVYIRHARYRSFYPAQASIDAVTPTIRT